MKRIFKIFTNRWFISVLGLLAILLVIYLAGPLIGIGDSRPLESTNARLITILVVIVLWMLNHLRKALRANRANKQMVESLVDDAGEAEPDRSAEEVATLGKRFEEAVEVLKQSKGSKGSLNLYELPWYIIIGPPGSGKTTALINSGLEFPLADRFGKEALRGVGGTRNCDWWFTEEAILLDTAGRYTTQDSDADVDSSAWRGFLALLKKYRKRRPINGVLVAISLSDLMTQSETERLAHARAIKSRIQELDEFFGIRFPVYVILTKTDLVAGFTEFFDDLGRTEREQILGTTFSLDESSSASDAVDRFGGEFDAILERLSSRVLWRLSGERDIKRRAAIYGFPRQLASLKEPISTFLGDVFRGSRFEQAPMLRGIYFTSGTQEGTPIDRLMNTVARTFGLEEQMLPAHGGQGRSYFITSLFKKVVFAESEIAGTNRRVELQRAWLQKAAYIGSVGLTVLVIVGWAVSYANNTAQINATVAATQLAAQAVDDIPTENRDPLVVLPALDAVQNIPGSSADTESGGQFLARLGLYQGNKLGALADSAYRRLLIEVLLPRLILRLEDNLKEGGASTDFQYEALKAYLMLDSLDHYDAAEIIAWIRFDLSSNMRREINTVQRESLFAHLDALLAEQPMPLPLPLDPGLIERTQRVVARMPTEERVYSRLKRKGLGQELPDFTVFAAAGPRSQIVFSRKSRANLNEGIPGFYTKEGYQRVFVVESAVLAKELTNESWILGPYTPPLTEDALLMSRVKDLYLDDFARQYEGLIMDIELAPFSSPQEAVNILNILSDPVNSPLLLLLKGVQRETQLDLLPSMPGEKDDLTSKASSRLDQLLGRATPRAVTAAARKLNRVEAKFKWVDDMVGGEDPSSAPIQHLLALIEELYRFMATVVSQQGPAGDIPAHVAGQGQAVIQQLQMEASRQPDMVKSMLSSAAARTQSLAFSGVAAQINTEWRSRGLSFCQQAISNRYPIVRTSSQEIRLDDFGQFFGPGGIVDTFFRQYLASYVDMSRSPWRVRTSGAVPIKISADSLRQFERANAIKETFFRGGGTTPSVRFEMTPLGMDATISQFSLSLADKTIVYGFGPQITEYMEWPGPDQNAEVRIEMSPPIPGSASMIRERGPWAWFRVLDKANISEASQPEHFQVEFRIGNRTAAYELIARSAYNPFRFDDLEQFRCPESL